MVRTDFDSILSPAFVVDPKSINRGGGRQWDWSNVPISFKNATTGKKVIPAGTAFGVSAAGLMVPRSATQSITSVVVASNVATATKTAHGYAVGDVVYISGSNLAYANGTHTVLSVADANTFTYTATGANATATGTILSSRGAVGFSETAAVEDSPSAALTGYGTIVGGVLFENLLPDATGSPKVLDTALKAELAATGTGFSFRQYANSLS